MNRADMDRKMAGWGRAAIAAGMSWLAGVAGVMAQPCGTPQWTEADPHPFGEYVMVYDSAHDVIVALVNGVTWESPDAQHWVRRTDAGPGARSGTSMVYDESRGVCVLFGGTELSTEQQTHGDTWQWDGSEWELVANTGPGPRYAHAMAYDSAAQRVVLFGGRTSIFGSGVELGDTWVWNGTAWGLLTDVGPSPRLGAAMGFDSHRERIVLAGGGPTPGNRPETWELNGDTWNLLDVTSAAGRTSGLPLVYDPVRRVTVAIADYSTWEWNGQFWEERDVVNAQGYRLGAGMTYYPPAQSVVLCGGLFSPSPTLLDQFWAWDGDAWRPRGVPAERPVRRVWAAMAYDTARGRSVMHGGWINYLGGSFLANGETWEWDGAQWTLRGSNGPAVMRHAMAYDSARGVTVLFGGENTLFGTPTDDTWEWDGQTWVLVATGGPPLSVTDPMCFDSARAVCVLVHNGETWEWDGASWMQRLATGSPGSPGSAMAYDVDRGVSVLFGGEAEYPDSRNETWEWNGDQWMQRSSTNAPEERFQPALVYDIVRRRTVLFGGSIIVSPGDRMGLRDTAEWDGAQWMLLGEYGPSPRGASAAAYDSARGELVLFSGLGEFAAEYNREDTWVRRSNDLGAEPVVVAPPEDLSVPAGDPASFSVVAEGAGVLTYQWRRNAVPLQEAFPFMGVRSPTLLISEARSPLAGEYDVVITNECGPTTSRPATLTVLPCRVDFNVDGVLNSQDYFDFLTAFFAGSPGADFDGSGTVDPADFFSFLDAFFHPAC